MRTEDQNPRPSGRGVVKDGPQIVTKRGTQTAVLIPLDEWHRLQAAARPSLKELLLSKEACTNALVVPPLGKAKRRPVPEPR